MFISKKNMEISNQKYLFTLQVLKISNLFFCFLDHDMEIIKVENEIC